METENKSGIDIINNSKEKRFIFLAQLFSLEVEQPIHIIYFKNKNNNNIFLISTFEGEISNVWTRKIYEE